MNTTVTVKSLTLSSLYFNSISRIAEIDFTNNMITTHNNLDGDRVNTFFPVQKFEAFQFVKYLLPLSAIYFFGYFLHDLKSELALLTLAVVPVLWHFFLREMNRNYIYVAMIISMLMAVVVGTMTMTLTIFLKVFFAMIVSVSIYEAALGFASNEYLRMRKVYIPGMPKFFSYYFVLPISQETQKEIDMQAKNRLQKYLLLVALVFFSISATELFFTAKAYQKTCIEHKKAMQAMMINKMMQERNLEAQRNHTIERIVEVTDKIYTEKEQKINKLLKINPQAIQKTTELYPWEPGYQHAGEFIYYNGKLVSSKYYESNVSK